MLQPTILNQNVGFILTRLKKNKEVDNVTYLPKHCLVFVLQDFPAELENNKKASRKIFSKAYKASEMHSIKIENNLQNSVPREKSVL